MTDKHARRPKDDHDGHWRRSQDRHQPNGQPTTHSSARPAPHVEQGQRATRPSATSLSAYPVIESTPSYAASHDGRANTTLVHAAQNVAPAAPSGSELLRLVETFIDRANVNLNDPRHQISIMNLQSAIMSQDEEIRRLRADIQRRDAEYGALNAFSNTIPDIEARLEDRVHTLDLENQKLRWAIRQLHPVGPFIERQNMQIEQKTWHIQQQDENRKELEEDNEKLEKDVEDLKRQLEYEKAKGQKDNERFQQQQPSFADAFRAHRSRSRIFDSSHFRGLDSGSTSSASPQPTTQATPAAASRSERDAAFAEHTTTLPTRPRSMTSRLPERRYARDRSMSPIGSPPQRDFREARAPSPPVSRRLRPGDAVVHPNRDRLSTALSRHPRGIPPGLNDNTFAGQARLGNHSVESGQQPLSRHNNLTRNDERRSSGRKLQCVGCYMRGSSCDGGLPCNHCKFAGKGRCRYRACYHHSQGRECTFEHCTMVHDEIDHL